LNEYNFQKSGKIQPFQNNIVEIKVKALSALEENEVFSEYSKKYCNSFKTTSTKSDNYFLMKSKRKTSF
jgi:hypothetical protein